MPSSSNSLSLSSLILSPLSDPNLVEAGGPRCFGIVVAQDSSGERGDHRLHHQQLPCAVASPAAAASSIPDATLYYGRYIASRGGIA